MTTKLAHMAIDMAADLRKQGAVPTELRLSRASADRLARELGQPCWRKGMLFDGMRVVVMELAPSA